MRSEPYATNHMLFYPGESLDPGERARMDNYEIGIEEVSVDHLVYSMSRQIEMNFQTFYEVAEDLVGEERALEIAFEIGRRYGGKGYEKFLKARGFEGRGSPQTMALYQDLVHAIRGPKHARALFATYDERECVVRRKGCIYYNEEAPERGKYAGAFEAGCFEGYKEADPNLLRVEVHACKWRGDAGCDQHWVYAEEPTAESGIDDGESPA